MHKYTPKEIRFIKDKIAGRSVAEMTGLFNRRFGLSITVPQMRSCLGNYRLRSGRNTRFRPGHVPFNKGLKKYWTGGEETRFKPGSLHWNHRPVGTERTNREGCLEVKIADPKTWKGKHILIWEAANGPVHKGHAILFADADRSNLALDNLLMVSRSELAVMTHGGLDFANSDATKAGKTIADIKIKIADRKRGVKKVHHD
jgi:hypothetical protein